MLEPSGPADFQWAIYRFNPGFSLDSLNVLLKASPSTGWVGLSDYRRGTWEFHSATTGDETPPLETWQSFSLEPRENYESPHGDVYCLVFAVGQPTEVLEVVAFGLFSAPLTVDDEWAAAGAYSSLRVVNGNPAMSFRTYPNGLRYVRATDSSGSAWGMPVTVESELLTPRRGIYWTSLAIVNGHPAIGYSVLVNDAHVSHGEVRYARAADPDGSAWSSPITLDVVGAGELYTSLAIVSGFPAVAYTDSDSERLLYVRAADAEGSDWGASLAIDTGSCWNPSLTVVNGCPAISYGRYSNGMGTLRYARAVDSDGSVWSSPMTVAADSGGETSLAVVNGKPAIGYENFGVFYVRAIDPDGTVWGNPSVVDSDLGGGISLALIGGRPAISYYGQNKGDLRYVRAVDPTGLAWGVPQELDSDDCRYCGYTSLAEVGGDPAITYSAESTLRYVREL